MESEGAEQQVQHGFKTHCISATSPHRKRGNIETFHRKVYYFFICMLRTMLLVFAWQWSVFSKRVPNAADVTLDVRMT